MIAGKLGEIGGHISAVASRRNVSTPFYSRRPVSSSTDVYSR